MAPILQACCIPKGGCTLKGEAYNGRTEFKCKIALARNDMSDKVKPMCKWDKDKLKKDFSGFQSMVVGAKYACMKCGRVAKSKKSLCKPASLD